ncbi:MAG: response regulator [Vicinamibacterales bacterium]
MVLVDDEPDTREMYEAWLQQVGFVVFGASDVETAFALALDHLPRVVVTDYLLKIGSTGAELCRRLKDDPRTTHIPTLLMTGLADRQTADKALGAGCAVVRLKPYLPDAMVSDIEAMMRGDRLKPFPPEHDAIHGN